MRHPESIGKNGSGGIYLKGMPIPADDPERKVVFMQQDRTMETIKRVVASVIPDGRVLLFGSRARGFNPLLLR